MSDPTALSASHQQDRVHLSKALEAYNANQFAQCIEHLREVAATTAADPKVAHNLAVAQFCASEQREYAAFQHSLRSVLTAAAEAAGEKSGDATTDGGTSQSPMQITDISLLPVHFNRAVVLFHLRQPKAALRILTALMPHLSEMDDTLAQRSGLLTIHLLLNSYQVRRAGALIEQLQQRLRASAPELLADDADYDDDDTNVLSLAGLSGGAFNRIAVDSGNISGSDGASDKKLLPGTLASGSGAAASAVDAAKLATTAGGGAGATTAATTSATAAEKRFRWMFRLYELRWSVLSGRNWMIENEDTSEMSVLRAHQFYNGIDYQMAAKELSKQFVNTPATIDNNGEDHNTVIANNMGIVHFHVRHYAMSVRFFQHALTFDQSAADAAVAAAGGADKPVPVQCLGATKRPEILYNLGVAMLHLQRPREAFECLLVPLNYYHSNPRIWLRLAEACIMVHSQSGKERECKTLVSSVIGLGVHRKYVVQPSPTKYVSDQSQSFAIPSTNLEFASLCLRNAWTLVDFHAGQFRARSANAAAAAAAASSSASAGIETTENNLPQAQPSAASGGESGGGGGAAGAAGGSLPERTECSPSKPPTTQSFHNMRCAVLAASAYVQICLGEYQLALDYARKLAQLEQLPDAYAMLAHLYCAEALIMLDRVADARKYLEPKFIQELKEDDFIARGSPDWPINNLEGAHAILTYNLAVTFLLNGECDVARSVLAQCQHHPLVLRHVKAAQLYLELQAGNVEHCRAMIRLDTPQHV